VSSSIYKRREAIARPASGQDRIIAADALWLGRSFCRAAALGGPSRWKTRKVGESSVIHIKFLMKIKEIFWDRRSRISRPDSPMTSECQIRSLQKRGQMHLGAAHDALQTIRTKGYRGLRSAEFESGYRSERDEGRYHTKALLFFKVGTPPNSTPPAGTSQGAGVVSPCMLISRAGFGGPLLGFHPVCVYL
jgi:hypothetical protein